MAVPFSTAGIPISPSNRCVGPLVPMGMLAIVLAGSVGCGGPMPAGTYHCYGHEKGLMADAGVLFLHEDGTAEFNGREGKWTYDRAAKTVQFTEGISFERVDYDPERQELKVELGLLRSHADQGVMYCAPMQE